MHCAGGFVPACATFSQCSTARTKDAFKVVCVGLEIKFRERLCLQLFNELRNP